MIKFSLVVPTLGRTTELSDLLDSLNNQTYKNFEVIVVDQNIDNRLDEILKIYSNVLNLVRIKCVSIGASHARNVGLELAKGEIVTFPDDDCEYPNRLLQDVYERFSANDVSGITFSSCERNGSGSMARFSKKMQYIHKFNVFNTSVEYTIFIYRHCLVGIRFDENFGVGSPTMLWSDEGPDFLLKLLDAGRVLLYIPDLCIYHQNPVKLYDEKSFLRSYRYGCGRGGFLRKNNYPIWFVFYVWLLYVVGVFIGIFQGNINKSMYYYCGLKGRIKGYLFLSEFLSVGS